MNVKAAYYLILAAIAAAGATVAEALGGWDTSLQTLVVLMAIDYVTGILCAAVWKKSPKSESGAFESKASLKGLIRKGAILLVVYIATRLDVMTGTTITRTAVIMFFIANDGFSIIENIGIMGVPMPPQIKNAFALLRKDETAEKVDTITTAEIIPGPDIMEQLYPDEGDDDHGKNDPHEYTGQHLNDTGPDETE